VEYSIEDILADRDLEMELALEGGAETHPKRLY
jgi:hypothetical protein